MGRGYFGVDKNNVQAILADLEKINGVSMPEGKKQQRLLGRHLMNVTHDEPLKIYVGSCPDYSHDGGKYTHEGIGEGVPLLTKMHLTYEVSMLEALRDHDIPFTYTIMVADVEAEDTVFCERFTNGNQDEFVKRCHQSVEETKSLLQLDAALSNVSRNINASSFFQEFGKERFLEYQGKYMDVLTNLYGSEPDFIAKVDDDVIARRKLYGKMYGHLLKDMDSDQKAEFLAVRTMRTMAQYLTLGRLIGEEAKYPVIINHPTRNISMYNQRNKYRLNGDIVGQQLPIPILKMEREVY
ncbi:hypothetical protein IPM62_01095 [Candidatus Woesebacteria bacterium]|nr:MAG: hypothetical protein IPM62_01095 [Candidatus Woesebacteria bacterium]